MGINDTGRASASMCEGQYYKDLSRIFLLHALYQGC